MRSIVTFLTIPVLSALLLMPSASAAAVKWERDVERGLQTANQLGKPVFMKFTADWCGYCKKMEHETFTKPAVAAAVNQNFVPVLVDADEHEALVEHLGIEGLPAMLIVSPEMVILEKISGYHTEEKLMPKISVGLAKFRSQQSQQTAVAANGKTAQSPTRPVSAGSEQVVAPSPFAKTAKPSQPQTEPQRPAFGGLCLPAVNETRSLISGTPKIAAKYRGKVLYFSEQKYLDKFKKEPTKYWPQRAGACPVTMVEDSQVVEGQLQFAAVFRGKLWVTKDAAAMKKFVDNPASYVDALPAQ